MYISLFSCYLEKKKIIYTWKDIEAKCLFNFLYLKASSVVVVVGRGVDCSKLYLAFCLHENLKKLN